MLSLTWKRARTKWNSNWFHLPIAARISSSPERGSVIRSARSVHSHEQVSVLRREIAAAHRAAFRDLNSLLLELRRGGVHAIAQASWLGSIVEDVAHVGVAAGAQHFG